MHLKLHELCPPPLPRYQALVRVFGLLLTAALALPTCASTEPQPPAPPPTAAPPTALSLTATALPANAPRPCETSQSLTTFTSPQAPVQGKPVRFIVVSETDVAGTLVVRDDTGKTVFSAPRRGGPPFFWFAEIENPTAGPLKASIETETTALNCTSVAIATDVEEPTRAFSSFVWSPKTEWSRATENLFSAWIETLFDAPLEASLSWPILHDVLRDPRRNFLHSHLGRHEDDGGPKGISIDPDCADLPYFLRAYFAFKLDLPFGYSGCTRGSATSPPKCVKWRSVKDARIDVRNDPPRAFGSFLRVTVADAVHSGNGRVPATSDDGDYYPVPLTAASLRPGTIFADPYGHVLMLVKRIDQTPERGGILLAVDGQPDGTVARRRFWRGNFLFAIDPMLGSAGFKRFRPISLQGRPHALTNEAITKSPDYGDYSLEQYAGTVDDFYDHVGDALSPSPLDPERALLETIDALEEQVKGRVKSVQNGTEHFQKGGKRIDMPDGSEIFETQGDWEDFSTPSRDLRLLIAIDIVKTFPERVAKRAHRYAMPAGKKPDDVRTDLEKRLELELSKRTVAYVRSDGSSFSLSLADVVARATELEMAYNPNDCPEVRWGAPQSSAEVSTCKRRAPLDQRSKMSRSRAWFRDRKRPARGV